MAHEADTADSFAEGFVAALNYMKRDLHEARQRLDAELKEKGVERAEQPAPRVVEDPGGGVVYCVKLDHNIYFSYYCVDVTNNYAWYVPR